MKASQLLEQSLVLIRKVGQFIKNEQKNDIKNYVETKSLHNYVTYVDKTAERILIDGLAEILPNSGFLAEEGTIQLDSNNELIWIIDPLDGTTNYIHRLAPTAISVALMQHNKPILGIIYEIFFDEMFWATEDIEGAFCNGKPIKVSNTTKVNDSLIATGFPYYNYEYLHEYMQTIEYFMKNSHGLRRLGSAATDLAYVAAGRFDAFYEYGLSPWDVAAGAFIVEKAGGMVSDFFGENNYLFGKQILASNSLIHSEFLEIIKNFFIRK